ncbi:hypothetical protein HDU81_011354 [Chytriomyces hyalinus]|nr:hypothetical protein HDU81_011354 [Chytriomyces hyalinus]
MAGAEAYYQQDLALAAMNVIKAPMTVENPYSMPFDQLLQELLCSEAGNKMMSRVLSCGCSKNPAMFNFRLIFETRPSLRASTLKSVQLNPLWIQTRSRKGKDSRTLAEEAEAGRMYIKPQYHKQLMDSSDRIARYFNSQLYLSNEAEENVTQIIRFMSKTLVMGSAHFFAYTPSDNIVLGYLGT